MDSLTQIVLGAAVGEAVLGKKVGNKALIWGAVAGTIPDLDVLSKFFLNDLQGLLFHRSVMHSFLFAIIISPLLAYLVHKLYATEKATYRDWVVFFLWCIITHPLLDIFTNYGTEIFYPFSDYRVAFNTIFVVDPLYTLPLLIGCVIVYLTPHDSLKRIRVITLALILSSSYLLLTCVNKWYVTKHVKESLEQQQIAYEEVMTTPAPFNNILWSVIVKGPDEYHVGYYSLFDKQDSLALLDIPKQPSLAEGYLTNEKFQHLVRFSKGFYTLEKKGQNIIFNDLRFSTISGWFNVHDEFVFSFF